MGRLPVLLLVLGSWSLETEAWVTRWLFRECVVRSERGEAGL